MGVMTVLDFIEGVGEDWREEGRGERGGEGGGRGERGEGEERRGEGEERGGRGGKGERKFRGKRRVRMSLHSMW